MAQPVKYNVYWLMSNAELLFNTKTCIKLITEMRIEWYVDVRVAYCILVTHRLENILPSPLISSADPGGMQGERKTEGEREGTEKGRGKYTIKFMSNPKVFRLQLSYIPDSRETRKVAEFKTSHLKPKG